MTPPVQPPTEEPEHCPRCDSPQPHLHPAVQHEGEVQICPHPWHEAVASTSLDQPGTGAGYTAVGPRGAAEPVRTIPAWQLTAAHVLLIDGRPVPLAVVDAGDDGQVIARPADGGWHHRFETYDGVQVVAGPVLGSQDAPAGPVLGEEARADLRTALYERITARLGRTGPAWLASVYAEAVEIALAPHVAALLSSAREEGARKLGRVHRLLAALDGWEHTETGGEHDPGDCIRCIADDVQHALDGPS